MKELRAYELAPNDLCFLLESCLRCYYLKLVGKVKQPSSSFPAHYTMIDSAMKRAFLDRAEGEYNEVGSLRFRVEKHNGYVKSVPIVFEDLGVSVAIRGTVDGFLQDDGDKRVLVDYKTHASDLPKLLKYRKQLMAYKYAAENPANPAKYPVRTIDRMGLIVFDESDFAFDASGARFTGALEWVEFDTDLTDFHALMARVAGVLALIEAPKAADSCEFCAYLAKSLAA